MHEPGYYREQAERARRLAKHADGEIQAALLRTAQDYDDIAEDLEIGAIEIRHAELFRNGADQANGLSWPSRSTEFRKERTGVSAIPVRSAQSRQPGV